MTNVRRCLCMWEGGRRRHVEAFEKNVVARMSGGNPEVGCHEHGGYFHVRRWTSECGVPLQHRLVSCSRGKGLDRNSPVLQICMETTRASLL